jgi:MFS family permease
MFETLNRNLRYLLILNLAFGFSVQLITPLFPLFLSDLGASPTEAALVISIGGLASTFLMLPGGLIVDRVDKKILLISSALLNMISLFLLTSTSTWKQVIPIFTVYTVSWVLSIPTRQAMISVNSDGKKRASIFGIMNTTWPIAGVISPIISGYLIESLGWNHVFLLGALINLVSILFGFRIQRREDVELSSNGYNFSEVFRGNILARLLTFFLFGTLISMAQGGVRLIFPLYLESNFALSPSKIALFFTLQSIFTLITQIPSGALADKYGRKRTLLSMIIPIPFLFASWHFIKDWRIMLGVNSLAFGLRTMTWPAYFTLLSNSVPEKLVGAAFVINSTGNRLGMTLGPMIASYFYVNYYNTAPFLGAGFISLVAVLFAAKIKDTVQE